MTPGTLRVTTIHDLVAIVLSTGQGEEFMEMGAGQAAVLVQRLEAAIEAVRQVEAASCHPGPGRASADPVASRCPR